MTQFINAKENLVTEAIDGLLRGTNGKLARLDGYPHIKVVMRADWDRSKVAIISGGGSGHEPAHAGFVGAGMLTAAVCGEVFASPSVDAVLAGILAVTGDPGCLLVVKNYTGDRLNFGLAAERARAIGRRVAMVVVGDDVALPDLAQPRGVAGTLFVHKIAGALAEEGASLQAVTNAAERVISGTASIGMSLNTCTVPGSPREDRIAIGQAELGLGIHGEPGVEQVAFEGARAAMRLVLDRLTPHLSAGDHIALVNNLGGATSLEMLVLAGEIAHSDLAGRIKWRIGPASMMTSLDMRGFSVSLLPATEENLKALNAPVAPAAWPQMTDLANPTVQALPEGIAVPQAVPSDNKVMQDLILRSCSIFEAAEEALNALDAKSGDGDTGATLTTAARGLRGAIDKLPLNSTAELFRAVAGELSQSMGGSSGVLLAIFFSAAGEASTNGADVATALKAGLQRLQSVGGGQLGDRTMIDALSPALDALPDGMSRAAASARIGADGTASIVRAKVGRAAYVSAGNLEGYNDPGAEAVALLFEGLNAAPAA